MRKLFFLSLFVILIGIKAFSTNAVISGTAIGAEGKILHVYEYSDLITMLEKELASVRIDSSGVFTVEIPVKTTSALILSIDFHRAELYAEPGKNYRISISALNYNSIVEINPFIESQPLEITVENETPKDLNTLIGAFNVVYNDFVLTNFNDLYKNKNVSKLNAFKDQIEKDFQDTNNDYFQAYVTYKSGELEQVVKPGSSQQLQRKYFTREPILYNNVEYMDLFNILFQKYILTGSRSLKFLDFPSILDKADSYQIMMKTMKTDTNLKRDDLRELVMLHGLMEMYYEPGYKKESVLRLLKEVAVKTKIEEHRVISENMVTVLTKLDKGTSAPDFRLADKHKTEVSLADLRGKPVMISFWTTYCPDCIGSLEKIKPIADKYSDRMNFVSISADKSFNKMLLYLKMKKNFTWTFLHVGESIDLLKDYNVKSYPLFVLIDENGMIYDKQAAAPGAGLEAEIEKLLNP